MENNYKGETNLLKTFKAGDYVFTHSQTAIILEKFYEYNIDWVKVYSFSDKRINIYLATDTGVEIPLSHIPDDQRLDNGFISEGV